MRVIPTAIPGPIVIEPRVFDDERGSFFETFHVERFADAGLPSAFVQDNVSTSRRGVRRSLGAPARGGASATIVPNSPQPGQRPSQRPDEVPHSLQTWWRAAALAMDTPRYSRGPTAFVPTS